MRDDVYSVPPHPASPPGGEGHLYVLLYHQREGRVPTPIAREKGGDEGPLSHVYERVVQMKYGS